MSKVIIIGGGPAGMIAAITSASRGNQTVLLEKNEKLGKKLYITGKGRCNLTNNCEPEEVLNNVITNSKFLFSSIYNFSPKDTIDFFTENGLKLKTERGKRVFPESDRASDVTKTLEKALIKSGVIIKYSTVAKEVLIKNSHVIGVTTNRGVIDCDCAVIATGGLSYPLTGSTGDGYTFAKKAGHKVTGIYPALNGIVIKTPINNANKLTLKNVTLTAKKSDKLLYSELGEIILTDYGISGPLALTCSSLINKQDLANVKLFIDFKPGLNEDKLSNRLIRDFSENKGQLKDVIRKLLPKEIVAPVLSRAGVAQNKNVSIISTEERLKIVKAVKSFPLLPTKIRPIEEAIVTSGGVNVKEVNPQTMESKLVEGLFFAGEVLDVDALTGGFNIQIALSTGFTAGSNV